MQFFLKRRQTQSLKNIARPTDDFFVSALKTVPLKVIARGNRDFLFLSELINFSASEGPEVEFPDARNCPEKI